MTFIRALLQTTCGTPEAIDGTFGTSGPGSSLIAESALHFKSGLGLWCTTAELPKRNHLVISLLLLHLTQTSHLKFMNFTRM